MTTIDLDAAWHRIRQMMAEVALPDSRFDLDLDRFIPAFEGIDIATAGATAQPAFAAAGTLFVTPDNSMQPLRHEALAAGKTLIIPTYGLKRGFLKLDPGTFDPALARFASWGDGVEYFGSPIAVEDIASIGAIDLVLAGAAAVTANGLRFGMGHRYLDVEWNIFRAASLVTDATPVWTIVHDHQVLEGNADAGSDEVLVDRSFTPTRTLDTPQSTRPIELGMATLVSLFDGTPPAPVARAVRLAEERVRWPPAE